MKLKKLSLANYRGFEQIDIDFEDDITVIAGINGVGKTGILKAIVSSVSHILPRLTVSAEPPIYFAETDVQNIKPSLQVSLNLELSQGDIYSDITRNHSLSIDEVKELGERRDRLRFDFRQTGKGSKEAIKIDDEIRRIELQLKKPEDEATVRVIPADSSNQPEDIASQIKESPNQPFVVFYSTNRFLSRLPPTLSRTMDIRQALAFSRSLDQLEVSLYDFANWYRVLKNDDYRDPALVGIILDELENAIAAFLPDVNGLELDNSNPPKFSIMKKGARFNLEQLSDGERGILALVFDLTRRLAIANSELSNPLAEGIAIVLVDEIELHLHPKWQRQVIRRLTTVFENCQFVITTHSPQVIGQVKAEKLRLLHLNNDEGKVALALVNQSYGMDSGWVLENIMGVPARDYDTEQKLSAIFDLIDNDSLANAREKIDELREEIGDFPDLQEASGLLDRLELLQGL